MSLSTHTTPSGYLLPSIHSAPPFFTEQPNPTTQSTATEQWIRLILGYARHRKLFVLRVEDAEAAGSEWDEILRNERINRRILPDHLSNIIATMVSKNLASYEPAKQTRSALIYWRLPEEWAEVLYDWVVSIGQLNTILTFYDITDPPLESALTNIPIPLLRKAIAILGKTGRSQMIAIADGEGVRFLARSR
ncbi:Vacuolar protein-sorting-associated protein 25 [Psilocybe cubensis]|uniref:Vacuolar protein-sorting-associated protein 25 n=2 Tax=Psilocybe cubensis TaxID=181762 RepID=A0ACB8GUS0_PSICU|nr:Vacuolar protein-sorting-associated protein 25 [Psilocybe cubensis]KAH9479182.1 Vacuolar protein-sorting-associated protein 25 [Psilocybe cubensis]